MVLLVLVILNFQRYLIFNFICVDCCDGSDEYDGVIDCLNICIMGGSINYKAEYRRIISLRNIVYVKESKLNGKFDLF